MENITTQKGFYKVEDIMAILEVSKGHAYKIIKRLNQELDAKGYITVAGKIPVKYFNERCYLGVA